MRGPPSATPWSWLLCHTALLPVSGPGCHVRLHYWQSLVLVVMSDCTTDTEDEGTTFFETKETTLPDSHMPGDLNPNCTTVRTSNVTGSGWHLIVCCSVDQAGSIGRHDSCTIWHTACHTQLLQHILSTHSGPFTTNYCLAAAPSPPVLSLLPPSTAGITHWHLCAYSISSVM
jgi:hypothetical protein